MRNAFVRRLTITAVLTAMTFLATYWIRFPGPLPPGYINLGDAIIIGAALAVDVRIACIAAGIGSALADALTPGAMVFAPFTLVIKVLEALVVWSVARSSARMSNNAKNVLLITAAVTGAFIMAAGYFLAEWYPLKWLANLIHSEFDFGLPFALSELPFNAIQGAAGVVCGYALALVLRRKDIQTIIHGKTA